MGADPVSPFSRFGIRRFSKRLYDDIRSLTTSSPARFAVLIFAALITLFTLLLWMPAATASGKRPPFADALFTAVSTICVTGLSTVDMGTYWSPFGLAIIYIGVNVGALG